MRHMLASCVIGCVGLLAPSTPLAAQAGPPTKVALTGARIITVSGADIESGTVLIEHGIITAVGPDIDIPFDATEIDVSGKVLFPGMIDPHSARGLDVPNENLPVAPFLDVYDALDPSRLFFEDALRDGITTVHVIQANNLVIGGLSRAVRPIGLTVDEMTIQPRIGLKLATTPRSGYDRMRQMASLREAFDELAHYEERLAERKYEESLKDKPVDVGPAEARERGKALVKDEDYDDRHLNLMRLRRGDLAAWIYAGRATDVGRAIALAEEQGFLEKSVLVLGPESFKAVAEIKKSGVPVVLDENLFFRDRDPITRELIEVFVPRVMHENGIAFALQTHPSGSMAERYLNYQAALCVRNGIPRQTALESITLTPARMLGLGERLGSIEVGKAGNIVAFSGDPLDFNSWVEYVYIDGILAYDRSKDHRLQKLLELGRANESKPASPEEPPAEAAPTDQPAPESGGDAPAESGERRPDRPQREGGRP